VASLACGSGGDGEELSVDVRTDFAPGAEFDLVVVELASGERRETGALNSPEVVASFLEGRRVAEFDGIGRGGIDVTASLIRASDATTIATRTVRVQIQSATAVTIVFTRNCAGVRCPGLDDAASATECVDGVCVTPECTPENPEACPEELGCATSSECTGVPLHPCAMRVCSSRVCFIERDDTACEMGEYCDPLDGCVEIDMRDGGVPVRDDAGPLTCGEPCDTGNPCTTGTFVCEDEIPSCIPDGDVAAGTPCSVGSDDGSCDGGGACVVGCIDGAPCTRPNGCEAGVTRCEEGRSVCEADGPLPEGTVCRVAADACDAPETCDGSEIECPDDAYLDAGTECRGAVGGCDAVETCTGDAPNCPSDSPRPAGSMCTTGGGEDGFCDGLSSDCMEGCVPGAACSTGDACAIGALDCSGSAPVCVATGPAAAGTECRASEGPCDVAETCNGSSMVCPSDSFRSGFECRPAMGDCDVAEVCTGSGPNCPSDAVAPGTQTCRSATGGCDVAETCDGATKTCPTDAVRGAGFVCRSDAGECDVQEVCSGVSKMCPTNAFEPIGTDCSSGFCNGSGTCQGGCNPGESCNPTVCETGVIDCSSGSPVCNRTGNRPDGTTCAPDDEGPWGACNYTSECDESATRSRSVTEYECDAGSCDGSTSTEFDPCSRSTDGNSCGAGFTCPGWGACGGYSDSCDPSGTQSRTCTSRVCGGGGCNSSSVPQNQPCSRGDRTGVSCSTCGTPVCQCASTSCNSVTTTVLVDNTGDPSNATLECSGYDSCTALGADSSCSITCPVGVNARVTCTDLPGGDGALRISADGSTCLCLGTADPNTGSCNRTVVEGLDFDCSVSERC